MNSKRLQIVGSIVPQPDFHQEDSTKADYIKNKPETTTEVIEGSGSLITSGGVYEALQNVGGGVDLTAGDGIEIKDGVIRSTLGDLIFNETKEMYVELYHEGNIEMGDNDGTYICGFEVSSDSVDTNTSLIVKFDLLDGTSKTFNIDIARFGDEDASETYYWGFNNCVLSDDGLNKIDETLDALYFEGGSFDADDGSSTFVMNFITWEDYTGASLLVSQSKIVENKKYATLPENALIAGDGIEIKDGVVRSTFGDTVTTTTEINNSYTTTLGTPNATSPFVMWKAVSTSPSEIYDDIKDGTSMTVSYMVDGEVVEIEVSTLFTSTILDTQFSVGSNFTGHYGLVNASQTVEEILTQGVWTRANSDNPTFVVCLAKHNTNGQSFLTIAAPKFLTGNTFIVTIHTTETESTTVKLPNEALNLDTVPTENSTNFINSGDLYNILGNIDVDVDMSDYYTKSEVDAILGDCSAILDEISSLIGE